MVKQLQGDKSLRGAAAIVGVGLSRFGDLKGRSHMEIMGEAVYHALADAGLTIKDVDGIFASNFVDQLTPLVVAEYFGIKPDFIDGSNVGGSAFVNALLSASLALKHGMCEVALVCYGSNNRSGGIVAPAHARTVESVYKPRYPVQAYALAAARHMYQYGTTQEQLAEVAVAARKWAQLNPAAEMRDPLTVADVLAARRVVDPFGVRDCCLVSDGGGAMILVKAERAKDFPKEAVYVLGVSSRTTHNIISEMPDLTVTAAAQSGPEAFAMARVTPADIDVVELYDAFTINTILFLEDMGFCKKGEGGAFVSNGNIAPGGKLPVNTNGGGLSCVHPGMYGIFLLIEAVQQLRGECGARQIKNAKLAACNGNGGYLSSQVTAVLGTADTL
jgi:acetyl-CoA acetyltransferase